MSQPQDASRRLSELARILASSRSASASSGSPDAASLMLNGVPIGRIRETTALLSEPPGTEIDDADVVAMRLLLLDYVGAVERLRAVVKLAEERLARARLVLLHGRRFERGLQEATTPEDSEAESDEP